MNQPTFTSTRFSESNKGTRITCFITAEDREFLDKIASQRCVSYGTVVRQAIGLLRAAKQQEIT